MQVKTERFSQLRQALETMMQRIAAGEDIIEQLAQIDAFSQELAPTAPKMLLHYLERKSYTKALAFLETLE